MANPRYLTSRYLTQRSCRPTFCLKLLMLVLLGLNAGPATLAQTPEPTIESVFAEALFDKWLAEGPHQQVPWEVRTSAHFLSIHQRLIANIEVQVSGTELVKRHTDDHITLLVQVTDKAGATNRNFGVLELSNMKPEMNKSDVVFSWEAFALPGDYIVDVALYDKVTGEHNLFRGKLRVDPLKNDPLPDAWQGLPSFEFWSTKREGLDFLFHSDVEGRLHLPLKTKRPVRLELLADVSPSDIFKGSIAAYEQYLAVALPTFKAFSQISVSNGSIHLATLDLLQRRVSFKQDDGKDMDWPRLKATLAPTNGPGVVSVSDLKEHRQSPVFLREELVRRISAPSEPEAPQTKETLHVFVLIGSPMDLYSFPDLPPIELGKESNYIFYYLQYQFLDQRRLTAADFFSQRGFPGSNSGTRHRPKSEASQVGRGLNGAIGNVQKMLKPLKVHAFKVHTADDVRHALAKVLAEIAEM
jgi:hypothetical protein